MAGFANVGAAFGVFGGVEVAEVLELVVFAHMVKYGVALPVGCFEVAVFGAFFGDLDFSACLTKLGIYLFLAFWTDAFGFTQSGNNHPTTASTISARGSSIIDIVTIRSYLRIFSMVEAEVNRRAEA